METEREKYYQEYSSAAPTKSQKILRFFPETDMRNGHDGLSRLAAKNGVKVNSLGVGEFLLFVNKAHTHAKLYASGNIIAHLRLPNHQRIDPRTIALIPKHFNGYQINYAGALKEILYKEFNYGEREN